MEHRVGFKLVFDRTELPRRPLSVIAKNRLIFSWIVKIILDRRSCVKNVCFAVTTGEEKKGKMFVHLHPVGKILVRLPAEPPEIEDVFAEEIKIT